MPTSSSLPSRQQMQTMLQLQAAMNSKVDADWVNAGYPYLRAVVIEAAEAIEHHGWKWWKKQQYDLPQLQMEIIDIWHFILSEVLLRANGDETAAGAQLMEDCGQENRSLVLDGKQYQLQTMSLLDKLELLIALSAIRRIETALFASIMRDCELDWETLFAQYVSKNVLNFFRQDHGYKDGSYQKLWHGKEDNEHLVEAMLMLPTDAEDFPQQLYQALKSRYPA